MAGSFWLSNKQKNGEESVKMYTENGNCGKISCLMRFHAKPNEILKEECRFIDDFNQYDKTSTIFIYLTYFVQLLRPVFLDQNFTGF